MPLERRRHRVRNQRATSSIIFWIVQFNHIAGIRLDWEVVEPMAISDSCANQLASIGIEIQGHTRDAWFPRVLDTIVIVIPPHKVANFHQSRRRLRWRRGGGRRGWGRRWGYWDGGLYEWRHPCWDWWHWRCRRRDWCCRWWYWRRGWWHWRWSSRDIKTGIEGMIILSRSMRDNRYHRETTVRIWQSGQARDSRFGANWQNSFGAIGVVKSTKGFC